MDDLVERMQVRIAEIEAENGEHADEWMEDGTLGLLREAVERIFTLQEDVSAGEELANAVGPLVEESMERNGPQVRADIVEAYRAIRERQLT